jgi:hypothetical protein
MSAHAFHRAPEAPDDDASRHGYKALGRPARCAGLAWPLRRLVKSDVERGELGVVGNASWCFRFDIVLYRQRNRPHPVLGVLSAGLAATSHKHEPDIPDDQ